jgi:hypothetical protein
VSPETAVPAAPGAIPAPGPDSASWRAGRSARLAPALALVGALAGIVLGALFLLAAATKGADLALFTEQVEGYGIVGGPLARAVALALVPLEAILGMALIVGWRRRAAALATAGLLVLFIGVSAWALYTGKTGSCGCFGALSARGPADVIKEDLLMLVLAALAWLPAGAAAGGRARGWRTGLVALTGVAAAGFMFAAPRLPIDDWVTAVRPGVDVASLELGDAVPPAGPVLVALIDLGDAGLAATTASLNALADAPGAPKTVAFTEGDEARRGEYFWSQGPRFEVRELSRDTIHRMARTLPRVFLARDGKVVRTWNDAPPTPDELATALQGGNS